MKNLGSAEVLAGLRARMLTVQAADEARWGKMSAAGMMRHMALSNEVALGERTVGPVKMPVPPRVMKFLALRVPSEWPKNLDTAPELKVAAAEGAPLRSIAEETAGALATLEELARGQRWAGSHPFFGAMRYEDWLRWGYLHADHHLRQFGR